MESPEPNKNAASSESPALQESPFFDFLRTLSPIKPVKTAHVAHGFSELTIPSPLPVFTSPRLNPQSATNFLKMSKYSQSSNASFSRSQALAGDLDVSERIINQLPFALTHCTQKSHVIESSPQVQLSSPSGLLDEYLVDTVEVSSGKLLDPACSCLNQVDDMPEVSQCIRSKENTCKGDNVNEEIMNYIETKSDAQIASSEKNKDNSLVLESGNITDGDKQSVECSSLMLENINDISISNSYVKSHGDQNVLHTETQIAESEQKGNEDKNTQVLSKILQTGEQIGRRSQEPVENKSTDLEEAGQHQRGTRRRCLQFDDSAGHVKSISSKHEFLNPASISRCSMVPANPTDLGMLEPPESVLASSSNDCTLDSSLPMASKLILCPAKARGTHGDKLDRSVQNVGNSSFKVPLPSGIGLHLNSIVSTAAMSDRTLSIRSTENDHPTAQIEKPPSILKLHLFEESKSKSLPITVVGNSLTKNQGDQGETESIVTKNSSMSQLRYDSVHKLQGSIQMSPKNARKRTYTIDNEGCKRCNCRRSKCLKLYCECFAAGVYCAEPCACQGCFNKPEHEDMVLETRKQIESRNPLAFAPKILHRFTDSPANSIESNNKVTPSSARHKRGCNCKKSMCLKKYCECYQAGVGCSAGCRCDGCKNTFGIKEGYGEIIGMLPGIVDAESREDLSDGKLVMESRSNFIHSKQHRQPHSLTPITPSFQSSTHRKDEPRSQLPARRCLPSPESNNKILSCTKSPSSPRNLNTCDRRGMREGNVDIVFDQDLEFNTAGGMDQFSPRWDGFEDICSVSPLDRFSSKAAAMASTSNIKDSAKVSRVQFQGSVRFSGSLRWRSSPITPMPQLGGSKLRQESDSDIGYEILEDDTPDILKDTHTPIKTVTSSSPNHKRVSPPQGHLHSLRSNPSPGLRSGRKFVLQSISSFPSLTPYSDPKDSDSIE